MNRKKTQPESPVQVASEAQAPVPAGDEKPVEKTADASAEKGAENTEATAGNPAESTPASEPVAPPHPVRSRLELFRNALQEVAADPTPRTVHGVRVAARRLVAALGVIEQAEPESESAVTPASAEPGTAAPDVSTPAAPALETAAPADSAPKDSAPKTPEPVAAVETPKVEEAGAKTGDGESSETVTSGSTEDTAGAGPDQLKSALARVKKARKAFRKVALKFANVRDLDVARELLNELGRELMSEGDAGEPAMKNLESWLKKRRRKEAGDSTSALTGKNFRRLLRRLSRISELPLESAWSRTALEQQIAELRTQLLTELAAFRAKIHDEQALHALRLTGKRLRYTLELWDHPAAVSALHTLQSLQEHLGKHRDWSQLEDLITERRSALLRKERLPEVRQAMAALEPILRRRVDSLVLRFPALSDQLEALLQALPVQTPEAAGAAPDTAPADAAATPAVASESAASAAPPDSAPAAEVSAPAEASKPAPKRKAPQKRAPQRKASAASAEPTPATSADVAQAAPAADTGAADTGAADAPTAAPARAKPRTGSRAPKAKAPEVAPAPAPAKKAAASAQSDAAPGPAKPRVRKPRAAQPKHAAEGASNTASEQPSEGASDALVSPQHDEKKV